MSQGTPEPATDEAYTQGLDTGADEVIDLDEVVGSDEVDDLYDTGYSPPEKPLGMDRFGTTLAEQRDGETLDQRLAQEEPDPALAVDPVEGEVLDDGEVGRVRAGRLVEPDQGAHPDLDAELIASDVGIDGGAASAEEAAVHVIPDPVDSRQLFTLDTDPLDDVDADLSEDVEIDLELDRDDAAARGDR